MAKGYWLSVTNFSSETYQHQMPEACKGVSCSRACVGEPPPNPLGGDHRTGGQELLVKEALHIQMTPLKKCFNRDGGLEVPGCWTSDEAESSNLHQPLPSNDMYAQ